MLGILVLLFLFFGFRAVKSLFTTVQKEGLGGLLKHPFLLILGFLMLGSTVFLPIALVGALIASSSKNKNKKNNRARGNNSTRYYNPNNQYNYTHNPNPQATRNGTFQGNSFYTGYNSGQPNAYSNPGTQNAYSNPGTQNTFAPGAQNMYAKPHSFGLPTSARKRRRIVSKFNERYDLSLTEEQIDRIVDASFLSTDWAREICYMNQKYDNIYSYFATMNSWLKVYLHAFQVQTISSDFAMQERIAFDAFDQVFSDVCSDPNLPLDAAIRKINSKYFTNFDETTFMIAYRFMESKGKRYTLSFSSVVNNAEDIDSLLKKYEPVNQTTT